MEKTRRKGGREDEKTAFPAAAGEVRNALHQFANVPMHKLNLVCTKKFVDFYMALWYDTCIRGVLRLQCSGEPEEAGRVKP